MLIHQKDARPCVIVTDFNGEHAGVYPTAERAVEYIRDWCEAAVDGKPVELIEGVLGDDIHVHVVGSMADGPDYVISKGFYRD